MKSLLLFTCGVLVLVQNASGQSTAFSYQGRLLTNGSPATGSFDLRFELYPIPAGGNPASSALTNHAIGVSDGLFTTTLDFGVGIFTGTNYWLDIRVRPAGDLGPFSPLLPRQQILATPYAIFAATAGAVRDGGGSTNASNAGAWLLAGNTGIVPGQFLGTTDNAPLELGVRGERALRLEPTADGPNVIAGSRWNSVASGVRGATIGGGGSFSIGELNYVAGDYGVVGGGIGNEAHAPSTVISGGADNHIAALASSAVIGGGESNDIGSKSDHSTIAGGWMNSIGSLADDVFTFFGFSSTISGGSFNEIGSNSVQTVIAGGTFNVVEPNVTSSTIGGGQGNTIRRGGIASTVGGGVFNTVEAQAAYATIPGGDNNTAAGNYSFAAGHRAKALHHGAFVWADAQDSDFTSTAPNQVLIRAHGGVGIGTNAPSHPLELASGAHVTAGGTWTDASDVVLKENFSPVDRAAILRKVMELPVSSWNYKAESPTVRHVGPMAQDFRRLFELGENDRTITAVDRAGVTFAAIQGLHEELARKGEEIADLKRDLVELQKIVRELRNGTPPRPE